VAVSRRKRTRVSEPEVPELPIGPLKPNVTLGEFAVQWLGARDKRTRQGDTERLRDHVLPVLGRRRLRDLVADDVVGVVRTIVSKKGINQKSAKNAYRVFAELLGDALARGLVAQDPRVLPPDIWPDEVTAAPRPPLNAAQMRALTTSPRLDPDLRILNGLLLYTGLPAREACDSRFGAGSLPAVADTSPELATLLLPWRESGFESVYGRAPVADDWIVPRRSDPAASHTEGSAYKAFRRCCVALGIKPRSLNALRSRAP
jgi:hypothetical protein